MNRFRIYSSLARGVLIESRRRKDPWVVAILSFVIMIAAGALGLYGLQGLESFAKDLAVSVLGVFGTILAVLFSSRVLPEEIKQRTLYPLLARPISRMDFLIGKTLGAVLATWQSFLLLFAVTIATLAIFGVHFDFLIVQYLIAKLIGLSLLSCVTVLLTVYMTPAAAATMSFVLAFGSTMITRALTMSYMGTSGPVQVLYRLTNAAMPQYGLFDFGGRVANIAWSPVPMWVMGSLLLYALMYSAGAITLAWAGFRKRAL